MGSSPSKAEPVRGQHAAAVPAEALSSCTDSATTTSASAPGANGGRVGLAVAISSSPVCGLWQSRASVTPPAALPHPSPLLDAHEFIDACVIAGGVLA